MVEDVLLDVLPTPLPWRLGNIGHGRKTSDKTPSPYAKRMGMMALVLAVACITPDASAQTVKESIDVPRYSRLLLRAVGSGDQIYGCVNGNWALKAPDAKLLNPEGSVIGRHFAGPTWQLNDGSRIKGKVIAQQVAPDATGVPWLLLESVGGTGRFGTVRFIQRTGTHGGNAPHGSCSQSTMRRIPYTATYSFYETETMIRKISLARRPQAVGSGLHPESHFENTSKLSIWAGNKNVGAVFIFTGLYEDSYRLNTGARTPESTSVHRLAVSGVWPRDRRAGQ
jgi:hypothetical protein